MDRVTPRISNPGGGRGRGLWLVVGDPEVRARGGYGVMDFGVLLLVSSWNIDCRISIFWLAFNAKY